MSSSPENPFEAPRASVGSAGQPAGKRVRYTGGVVSTAFQVVCECGHATGVLASQAGSTVSCPCGKAVRVPSLGQLREQAGQARYETSLADTMRRLITTGELPAGDACALTGEPTDAVLNLMVMVPRLEWEERNHLVLKLVLLLLFGLPGFLMSFAMKGKVYIEEDAELVPTPLVIAPRAQSKVLGMSQRRLKRLLGSVPQYREIFEKNKNARVLLPTEDSE